MRLTDERKNTRGFTISHGLRGSSVAPQRINLVKQRLTREDTMIIFKDLQDSRLGIGDAGDMRSDGYPGMPPERMLRGQRFLTENIEQGAGKLTGIDGRHQILFDQMIAARHIDKKGSGWQLLEQLDIKKIAGLGGERQETDQDIADGKKIRQSLFPAVTRYPWQ